MWFKSLHTLVTYDCRVTLLVSVSSLVCEVGIIAIYATSLVLRQASDAMISPANSGSVGSHVDGGLDGLDSGRANTTESLLICMSILLTVTACVANVLGARRLLRGLRMGATSLRASAHALLRRSTPQRWAASRVHPGTVSTRRSAGGAHGDGDGGLEPHVEQTAAPSVESTPANQELLCGVPERVVPPPVTGQPQRVSLKDAVDVDGRGLIHVPVGIELAESESRGDGDVRAGLQT